MLTSFRILHSALAFAVATATAGAATYYAPRKRSPARDAGAEQSWSTNSLDLAGNGRLYGEIDIGCYELWPSTDGTKVLLR